MPLIFRLTSEDSDRNFATDVTFPGPAESSVIPSGASELFHTGDIFRVVPCLRGTGGLWPRSLAAAVLARRVQTLKSCLLVRDVEAVERGGPDHQKFQSE
jgi:hypothetical protein